MTGPCLARPSVHSPPNATRANQCAGALIPPVRQRMPKRSRPRGSAPAQPRAPTALSSGGGRPAQGGYRACSRLGIDCSRSPFLKISFETAAAFLTDATLHGVSDDLASPASRIVLGRVVEARGPALSWAREARLGLQTVDLGRVCSIVDYIFVHFHIWHAPQALPARDVACAVYIERSEGRAKHHK